MSLALPPATRPPATRPPATRPAVLVSSWQPGLSPGRPTAASRSPSASCGDPAGLQRTLRADGVPASVTFTGQQNPACQPYPHRHRPALQPFGPRADPLGGSRFVNHPKDAYNTPDALVIHPSALPSGAGLQIWTSGTPGAADNFQLHVSLVKASPQCTGSSRS